MKYSFPQHIDREGRGHMANNIHDPEYYRILKKYGHDIALPHVVDLDNEVVLSCSSSCVMYSAHSDTSLVQRLPDRMGVAKWRESMPETFRQCDNTSCPAFRHGLPHSHFERELPPLTDTDRAVTRLNMLKEFTTDGRLSLDETNAALTESPVKAWMNVPLEDLMQRVGEYITWVETGITAEVCKCNRIPHPTKPGVFSGETALDCPQHAKEGLVLGFFEWLRKNDQEPCGICSGRGCPDCDTAQIIRGEEIASNIHPCTLGNIATMDGVWVCCSAPFPLHADSCSERNCAAHGG